MRIKRGCRCDHRPSIRCDEAHCDIAGRGAPGDPNQCRQCWTRLGNRDTTSLSGAMLALPCGGCGKNKDKPVATLVKPLVWSYGVTTVPQRRDDLLPRTLLSLRKAGFDKPILFVDDCPDPQEWRIQFGLDVTPRFQRIKLAGNWALALVELFYRNPKADRYAIFQDDCLVYRNLRTYLDNSPLPGKGYANLFTFSWNHDIAHGRKGWYPTRQDGKGAVGLAFDRETVKTLLSSRHMWDRVDDPVNGPSRGAYKCIDGGIVEALRGCGFKEYVHNPSLVQHIGKDSTLNKSKGATGDETGYTVFNWTDNMAAPSFKGENYDALELLSELHK